MAKRVAILRRQIIAPSVTASAVASAVATHTFEAAAQDAEYASSPPCFFPMSQTLAVPVLSTRLESADSVVIRFALPPGTSLNLPVSSCIMMVGKGAGEGGKDVMRPYNPISSNAQLGSFDLLIKRYEGGPCSAFAHGLQAGDVVSFKQLKGNVKPFRYPFRGKRRITMLAGGTGITPMIQALHPLLSTRGDATEVRLLYGNKTGNDILLRNELDALARAHPSRLAVTYIIGAGPSDDAGTEDFVVGGGGGGGSGRSGNVERGWIDAAKIGRLAHPPGPQTTVWVCGPPGMYEALAGSRHDPLTDGSVLRKLGYTDDMVWRS